MFDAHDRWFITCRTFQARALMTPRTRLFREVCGGVLGRAAAACGVRLHGYVFLSNHLHLIVHAQGQRVATFMKYLLGNLSKKLGPLCEPAWWGRFWERRYTASPILDEAALEDRLRYVLAHGVKEGLVGRTSEWEGLHCAGQLVDEAPRRFRWFNWTRRWRARRRKEDAAVAEAGLYDDALGEVVQLELEPLPHWAAEPPARRQQRMRDLVAEVERESAPGAPPLGPEAVRRQSTERRRHRKRTPRPLCHASTGDGRAYFRALYRAFRDAFRAASKDWLAGNLQAEFPPGAFRPYVYSVRIV